MAFVNEYVSPEDITKYDLAGIFARFDKSLLGNPTWTIDRKNNVFLLWLRSSREESRNYQMFAMGWRGNVFPIYLIASGGGRYDQKSDTRWSLMELSLPVELQAECCEIVTSLKAALTEYTLRKLNIPVVDHTVTFEF